MKTLLKLGRFRLVKDPPPPVLTDEQVRRQMFLRRQAELIREDKRRLGL